MASSGMFALLGGISGGSHKYQDIQDDQRKFRLAEDAKKAEETRRQNLKQYGIDASPSGLVDPKGATVSKKGYEEAKESGDKSALAGMQTPTERQAAADLTAGGVAKGEEMSQHYDVSDPKNPVQLTNDQYALAKDSSDIKLSSKVGLKMAETDKNREDVLNKEVARRTTEEAKATKKQTAAEKKADKKYVEGIMKEVRKNASGTLGDDPTIALLKIGNIEQDPRLEATKAMKVARNLEKGAGWLEGKIKDEDIPKNKAIADLKSAGYTEKEIKLMYSLIGVQEESWFGGFEKESN